MARMTLILAVCGFAVLSSSAQVGAQASRSAERPIAQHFDRQLDAFIRQLRQSEGAPPGTAVVVVHGAKTVFERAYGTRDRDTGARLTLDTPMYNGSVTKAYTGLLAAILDNRGVLSLDASLADVWPSLRLKAPLDARAVVARKLLSHVGGIRDGGLGFRSVWTGQVTSADVPSHLAAYAAPQKPGFVYDNLGPFVWSAMAAARTKLPWAELLKREVLDPLGLGASAGRLEDLGRDRVARCHVRTTAWESQPPKPTATMNAAGGMYTSARDAAKFLQAFITDGASARGAISADVLRRTWMRESNQDRDMWDLHRDGYGLGWDLGTIDGHRFVARSGSYPGCRAIIIFLPKEQLGVAVLSNAGAGANTFDAAIIHQAFALWTDPHAEVSAAARLVSTRKTLAEAMTDAAAEAAKLPALKPVDPAVAHAAEGTFRNARLGDVRLRRHGQAIVLEAGVFRNSLRYVSGDRFVAVTDPESGSEDFLLLRNEAGEVVGFTWDDDRYDRIPT